MTKAKNGAPSALPTGDTTRIIEELGRLGEAPAAIAKPFKLGRERPAGQEKLTGLERMGDKIARALRPIFEALSQARTDVTAEPLAFHRWDQWSGGLPGFTSLSGYRLKPLHPGSSRADGQPGVASLRGGMVVAVEPGFVTALLERFYGGGSGETPPPALEFTAGEELLLSRMFERLMPMLATQWSDVVPVETQLAERDTSPYHFAFLRGDEAVVVQSFRIAPLECPPSTLSLVYPLSLLRPLEEQMSLRVHDDPIAEDHSWRDRLADALGQVPLPVRSVLARPEITLGQLMALKAGDVIPIQLGARTPLLVANHPIAEGQIGERDGRAALMIDRFKRS